jgi:membrane associated rhomboid family serine protease
MPLSENEQRILRQIEQQLERDPTFSTRGYKLPRRRVLLLSFALVASLALTVLLLGVTVWLSLAGFVVSLAIAVLLEREVRLVARERIAALPLSAWLGANNRRRPGSGSRNDDAEHLD